MTHRPHGSCHGATRAPKSTTNALLLVVLVIIVTVDVGVLGGWAVGGWWSDEGGCGGDDGQDRPLLVLVLG